MILIGNIVTFVVISKMDLQIIVVFGEKESIPVFVMASMELIVIDGNVRLLILILYNKFLC